VEVIDREIKSRLGQMTKGVEVVSARHQGLVRAYSSHWVTQVSFEEPVLMASISPKHDTYPLLRESGRFAVSILGADQVAQGQYFSYPGRKFRHIADEYLVEADGDHPDGPIDVIADCIAWLRCEVFSIEETIGGQALDHHLVFARVVSSGDFGRLKEPTLLYSSRLGWRRCGEAAREKGVSIRDELLARLEAADQAGSIRG
jgi:flavin reductase (DIM6/NTAB) family NADH-FMN oxidoreductase RutF